MLLDGLQMIEGSSAENLTVKSGTAFPSLPNAGELFFRTDIDGGTLHLYSNTEWVNLAATGGGGGSANFTQTLVRNTDFTGATMTVTHSLGKRFNVVTVYDDTGKMIIPDEIIATNTTSCVIELNLTLFGYSNNFTVVIAPGAI